MEPFHTFLTIKCTSCNAPLVRVSQSETNDIVVCPVCFAAGGFDDILEEGGALSAAYGCPSEIRTLVSAAWARRNAAGPI